MKKIPFNKPYMRGKEMDYMRQAVELGHISGNGHFTKRCQQAFEQNYGFGKCLLTTSCTDALEMAALLLDIQEGDEVIMPSYTFVSTANAFVLRGATLRFADSQAQHPNICLQSTEALINEKTKALVLVHYAGMACDMDAFVALCQKHKLYLIEDAAQAVDSFYKGKALGSFGELAAFSFHETKNIISGEGGMLLVNDMRFAERAEILWEKGTNRSAFFRGDVDKYGWVDMGSSFLASDILAAFLYAQIEQLEDIQARRKALWQSYAQRLRPLEEQGLLRLPQVPEHSSNNAHMFYMLTSSLQERDALLQHLRSEGIHAVFHYQSLHKSQFYASKHGNRPLPNCDMFSDCLLRLPLFYELQESDIERICQSLEEFYQNKG